MREFYDNTMVSGHRACPRKFFFRHELALRPEGTAAPLSFGLGWHAAMDVIWGKIHLVDMGRIDEATLIAAAYSKFEEKWVEGGFPPIDEVDGDWENKLKARTPSTCLGMLEEYVDHRRSYLSGLEVLAVERPFAVPLSPDDDELWYCGRLDKIIKMDGKVYIIDHKTTTAYKKDGGFRASFTDSFSPDSQMDGYAYAGKMLYGDEFGGVIIDGALVHKYVHDKFCLIPVMRGDEQLDAWLWETLEEVSRIRQNRGRVSNLTMDILPTYLPAFEKHTGTCWDFGSSCPYTDLCKGYPNPLEGILRDGTPMGFEEDPWQPFEINDLQKIGAKENDE